MKNECEVIFRHLVSVDNITSIEVDPAEEADIYIDALESIGLNKVIEAEKQIEYDAFILRPIYNDFIRGKELEFGTKNLWSNELIEKIDYEFVNKYYSGGKLANE